MNKYEKGLIEARDQGVITDDQRTRILALCAQERPWLQITCYSLGGVLLLGAVFFLMNGYWRLLHGMALVALTVAAALFFCSVGVKLIRRGERAAGGIFALAGLGLMPVAVHNLWSYAAAAGWIAEAPEAACILWNNGVFKRRELVMELSAIVSSLFMYGLTGEGLLLLPCCGALWFLFMTLTALFGFLFSTECAVTALTGALLLLAGICVKKREEDESIADARSLLLSAGAAYLWLSVLMEFPFGVPNAANCAILGGLSVIYIAAGAKAEKLFISLLGSVSALYALWYTFDTYYKGSHALPWFLFAAGSLVLGAGIFWGKQRKR